MYNNLIHEERILMKKIIAISLLIFSLCGCSRVWLNGNDNKQIDVSDTGITGTNLKGTDNILTLLYPYGNTKDQMQSVITRLNFLSKDRLGVTVNMITPDEYRTFHLDNYEAFLYQSLSSGMGPDIFISIEIYHDASVGGMNSPIPNDLVNNIKSGFVTDLNMYIDSSTPYLSYLYNSFKNILPFVSYKENIYGIYMPRSYNTNPAFIIDRSIGNQLSTAEYNSIHDAINACVEINEKKLRTDDQQIIFDPHNVIKHILYDSNYYSLLYAQPLMYLCDINDMSCNVHRIDETDILDKLFVYKDLFEQNSIKAGVNDVRDLLKNGNENLLAAVFSYSTFFSVDDSVFDRSKYDLHILTDYNNSVSGGQMLFSMFMVSSSCENPKKAVQWIDWLYSDPEANILIKYGIKDVNYKIDPDTKILYRDDTMTQFIPVISGHTVDNEIWLPESFYINFQDKWYTEKILQNITIFPMTQLIIQSSIEEEIPYLLKMRELLGNNKYADTINQENRLRSTLFMIFESSEKYSDLKKKLLDCKNDEFLQEIQKVINDSLN